MIFEPDELPTARLIAGNREPVLFNLHIAQNFHLLFPSGFDEVRFVHGNNSHNIDPNKLSRDLKVNVLMLNHDDDVSCGNLVWDRFQNLEFRHESSGAWYRFSMLAENYEEFEDYHYMKSTLCFYAPGTDEFVELTFSDIINSCYKRAGDVSRPSISLFPSIWTGEDLSMAHNDAIQQFIQKYEHEKLSFESLSWRQMEELVAELLKLQGMDVTVTPSQKDGGRDIIARGELIPGEPTIFAVEVKQKPVVGIHDVRAALYANRNMPALLIATSGRFSAGVIKESRISDNRYRLFLKDGVALKQWMSLCWNRLASNNNIGN
jgi:hypothetical protein